MPPENQVATQETTEVIEPKVEEQTTTAGEPVVEETPKVEVEKTPEIDWQARAEKAERDFKALSTGRQKQQERDNALHDRIDGLTAAFKASLKESGNSEALAEIEKVDGARAKQAKQALKVATSKKIEEIGKLLKIDLNTNLNFEESASLFEAGEYDKALNEAYEARDRITAQAGSPKEETNPGPAPKVGAKRPTTDLGGGSGGPGQPTWAQAQKISKVDDLSDEAYEKLITKE